MQRKTAPRFLAVCLVSAWVTGAIADPASDRALRTANGLLERGLAAEAIPEYRAALPALDSSGKIAQAQYGLAVALFRTGDFKGSIAALSQIESGDGFAFAADADLLGAHALQRLGSHAEAGRAFASFAGDHTEHASYPAAAALAVECTHRAGDHQRAIRLARRYGADLGDSDAGRRVAFFQAISLGAVGMHADAAELFESLAASKSGGVIAEQSMLRYAQALEATGKRARALEAYARAMEAGADPIRLDASIGRAALLRADGETEKAAELLKAVRKEAPAFRRARVGLELGLVDLDAGRPGAAHAHFLEAEKDKSLADDAAYWHAKADLRSGNAGSAAERLAVALETFGASPLRPEMMFDLAVSHERAGDADGASEGFRAFRAAYPEHAMVPDALVAESALALAADDYEGAARLAMGVLREHSDHGRVPDAAFVLGEAAYRSGDFGGAITVFEQMQTLDGVSDDLAARARYRLGMALASEGRGDEAREYLEGVTDGVETDARFRPALIALGDSAFDREEWASAASWYGAYLAAPAGGSDRRDGGDTGSRQDASMKLALCHARRGEHERAAALFDRIAAGDGPHAAHALFESGQSMVSLDRDGAAAERFEALLAEHAGSRFEAHALRHLGSISMKRGDAEAADEYLAGAVGLSGRSDELDIERARALLDLGQTAEAVEVVSPRRRGESAARTAWRVIAMSRDGRDEDASRQYGRMDRAPGDGSLAALLDFEAARVYRRLGRDAEAEAILTGLVGRGGGGAVSSHASVEMASVHIEAERFEQAIEILDPLLDSEGVPSELCASVLYQASWASFRLGDHGRVVALLDPDDRRCGLGDLTPAGEMLLGESLLSLGKARAAAERFGLIVASHAGCEQEPMALLRLGDSLAEAQVWTESGAAYGRYLKEYGETPAWFRARFGLGWATENGGDPDGAIEHYRVVTDRHTGETAARAQFQIGECLFAMGRHEEAVRELLRVDILHAEPEWSAAAIYEAGRCFEKLGKLGEARAQYRGVRSRFAESDWAAAAGERLAAIGGTRVPGRGGQD